ncbi:MAG: acyltransferase domain-containing protein [Chloroflexota bacterium]|nr:acyltransferase domain-containing protein [Chloroflexota bacterium]
MSSEPRDEIAPQDWAVTQRSFPPAGPPFLQESFVVQACADAYLPGDVRDAAVDVARHVNDDPALVAFAWHAHCTLFTPGLYDRDAIRRWPVLGTALGEPAGLYYLLVLLSGVPRLRELYRQHDIPPAVARDTLHDLERWLRHHRSEHGAWGLAPRALTWLRNHMQGQLFQLGRLQHQLNEFQCDARVYRHRADGTVVALSDNGIRYRADGQYDGAGGVFDAEGAWTATLSVDSAAVAGFPVSPRGYVVQREAHLPLAAWKEVLAPGDPVLQLHIPDGSPMDYAACGDSFRQALDFFPRHFPAHRFRAFACSSWLLDAQLQVLLPPSSNLVKFQREMYVLPAPGDGRSTLSTVFDGVPEDLGRASQETTLQRALAAHLIGGGHARSGRCFLLRDDLRWGSQVYLRQVYLQAESRILSEAATAPFGGVTPPPE